VKTLLALVVVLIVAAGCGAYVVLGRVDAPFRGYSEEAQFVDIPQGAGTRAIGERLIAAGVVRDRVTYRAALWLSGTARHLKAGEYRFDHPMSPRDVLGKIARGEVDLISITFPEGLTIADMAHLYESHGFGPAAEFKAAAKDVTAIRELDPTATDLEGYLFPETYALPRRAHASDLVRAMTDRFQKVLTSELRAESAAHGLTVRQLVTLASIVEKETARPEERPIVAAVYANRLRLGMGLQCDPTVIYALQRAGRYDGNIHHDDLMFDSPYNTYRYAGLPPGPIAAPGKSSLEAAANPAENDFLYFVSRNDGTHEFARTLSEHNRNVQKFQIQYFRDLRARQHQ
jgi:UPF0755 protein